MIPNDAQIAHILRTTGCVACVGFSAKPERPSHYVSAFLKARGIRVIPVNPGLAGQSFLGETAVASLSDIPADAQVDMIDIFRRAEEINAIVGEAITVLPHLRTVWMQLGLRNPEAAARPKPPGWKWCRTAAPRSKSRGWGCIKLPHIRPVVRNQRTFGQPLKKPRVQFSGHPGHILLGEILQILLFRKIAFVEFSLQRIS